ncbi:hypothetical protein MPER_03514, partial [Moniliophthora perniciosa FA553]
AGLIATAGTLFAISDTPVRYYNASQKHLLWVAFNASQAIAFTPLYFLCPAIISRGALLTFAALAGTTWCNMTATTSADLESGNQLLLSVLAMVMASLAASAVLPAGLLGLTIP